MSKYLPRSAVLHELQQQASRRLHGLKNGDYVKYPSAEAKDYFVVKASRLLGTKGEQLKELIDQRLAVIALYRAEQEAKGVAAEKKDEN
jgi:hypothetical protein